MRSGLLVLGMVLCSIAPAAAQMTVGIGLPGVSIGINLPAYPQLVPVPGYPVYYAPQANSNYFFYDGLYWVYQADNWYASSWYNGPWGLVGPDAVPLFVLRIPVRYYRRPPEYFREWRPDAPPRWGERWGADWDQRRRGWDTWNRGSVPPPAPLPLYQRQYSGNRYPPMEQQRVLQSRNYRYRSHDPVVQQYDRTLQLHSGPGSSSQGRQRAPQQSVSPQQDARGFGPAASLQQGASQARGQPQTRGGNAQKPAVAQAPPQQAGPTAAKPGKQPQPSVRHAEQPRSQGDNGPRGRGPAPEPGQGQPRGGERPGQSVGERSD